MAVSLLYMAAQQMNKCTQLTNGEGLSVDNKKGRY